MQRKYAALLGGLFAVGAVGLGSSPLYAQSTEVKSKPAMDSYQGNWQVPRAKWAEFEKARPGTEKLVSQALSSGASPKAYFRDRRAAGSHAAAISHWASVGSVRPAHAA